LPELEQAAQTAGGGTADPVLMQICGRASEALSKRCEHAASSHAKTCLSPDAEVERLNAATKRQRSPREEEHRHCNHAEAVQPALNSGGGNFRRRRAGRTNGNSEKPSKATDNNKNSS
jgi:hypothetical protein